MKIDKDQEIAGMSVLRLRSLLRYNQFKSSPTKDFAKQLNLSVQSTENKLNKICEEGYLEKEKDGRTWRNTIKGNALAISSVSRFKRSSCEKAVSDLLERTKKLNSNDIYAYTVEKIFVFGSYLTNQNYLGDVDLFLEFKPRYSNPEKQKEIEEKAKERNPNFRSFSEDMSRPFDEVIRILKSRSRILSICSAIPPEARRKLIYKNES